MKDVKINKDCYVPKRNVKFYVGYNSSAVVKEVRQKRKEGLVIDYTNGKKILSVIHLISGEMIIVNVAPETLNARMEAAEEDI